MVGVKNMSKYEKMIAVNKQVSAEKISTAVKIIHQMLDEQQKVTVPELVRKTGFSRGFFYKNAVVRKEIDGAMQQQVGLINPKKRIIDMAMENRIELLEKQVAQLKRENKELEEKNKALQKALNKKDLNLLKKI